MPADVPLQIAKVQEPTLRDATLSRERLLDWMRSKINHRVILVIAEAGYGKTTLLADFSRRSRQRVLWYRLDEGDQAWVGLLTYLIAAGREFIPTFGLATESLLREIGPGGPSRETAIETFVRELGVFADGPTVLILDDVHLVDHAEDFNDILRRIIERLPARMTLVLASRRPPSVRLGRLRGQGEVAELTGLDLRFDHDEIDRLFRDSYGQPLEPDVVREVARRTDGWAASLELIRAALQEREPGEAHGFVAELTGSRGQIYDYLAEEVVGELPSELQQFLMRSSILERLDEDLVSLTTDLDVAAVRRRMAEVERQGLVAKPSSRGAAGRRYHPLVREFLDARLRADIGDAQVAELHRRVAWAVESTDWATACRHLAAAGDTTDIPGVIERAIARIMATGDYAQAASVIDALDIDPVPPSFLIIRSRMALRRGNVAEALASAQSALAVAPASDAASLNLASALVNAGRLDEASQVARWLRDRGAESWARAVADATVGVIDASVAGEITSHIRHLTRLAEQDARSGNEHFHGVALLNLANAYRAVGDAKRAHALARRSIAIHQRTGAKPEEVSARLASAWALAHDADLAAARVEYGIALDMAVGRSRLECVNEIADLETWYGDSATAHQVLASVKPLTADAEMIDLLTSSRIQVMLRVGARETLADELSHLRFGFPCSVTGHEARRQALRAHVAVELGLGDAGDLAADAQLFAERQSAEFWARYVSLLVATTASRELFNGTLFEIASGDPTTCSLLAERIAKRLQDVEPATMRLIETEVQRRPERWRTALRTVVELYEPQGQNAAALLDIIGTREDVARLRQYARRTRRGDKSLGFALARRLAPRVFVEDQGQVEIHIGDRVVLGAKLRRKVLSLLCFLLTRRGLSATRDEVLEALWSDMDPGVALNSLNQTIYFLRRIFEPDYKDDLSPGYISHGSDLVWLDRELIASRSGRCRDLLDRAARTRAWDDVVALAEMYEGRFALDFAYEEWAASYRDSLHAGYLETLETAIANQLQDDRVELAIALARRAIDVDPDADELEVSLLRLYRASGAAAAAAEQYGHYAALARGTFGTEPPSLDALVEDR